MQQRIHRRRRLANFLKSVVFCVACVSPLLKSVLDGRIFFYPSWSPCPGGFGDALVNAQSLKLKFEAELQGSRSAHGVKLIRYSNSSWTTAESGNNLTKCGVRKISIRKIEVWMVQHIEGIHSEQQVKSFMDRKTTLDRRVQRVKTWAPDEVASEGPLPNG